MLRVFVFLLLINCSRTFAQSVSAKFGNYSPEEIALEDCSFDPGAEAVVLFDRAEANYDDQQQLLFTRHIRIKILKASAIDRANIRIVYYHEKDYEFIDQIKGAVYNAGSNPSMVNLDQNAIFRKPINSVYSQVVFALPSVQVGSIIEYTYRSTKKNYGGLKDWNFQQDIPVVQSAFNLFLMPNVEFAYTVHRTPGYDVYIKSNQEQGSTLFEMKEIPGMRDESFSRAEKDYLQRVVFQFSSYTDRTGFVHKSNNSWKQLAEELWKDEDFGRQVSKEIRIPEVNDFFKIESDPLNRLKQVYRFVRKSMSWNELNAKYTDGLKSAWAKKQGSAADINLLLVNLLRQADIDAHPMLVSERSYGVVDTSYPYLNQFNKVVAFATLNGEEFILDATEQDVPCGTTPFDLLNSFGFIVSKKDPRLYYIESKRHVFGSVFSERTMIKPDGSLVADAEIDYSGYSRLGKIQHYTRNRKSFYNQYLGNTNLLRIDTLQVSNQLDDSLAFHVSLKRVGKLEKSGDLYLLYFSDLLDYTENPFVSPNRFSPIDFGAPISVVYQGEFELPTNWKPTNLPKNMSMVNSDRSFTVMRAFEVNEQTLTVGIRMTLRRTVFDIDEYEDLQAYFKKVVSLLNEPLMLTKTN